MANHKSNRLSDKLLKTTLPNPFSGVQARNFSDKRLYSEFIPTSFFWTLFNDQHEVVIGTRGSGKTVLMRMMRYSMLKRIDDDKARSLVDDIRFFTLYAPMNNEFIERISPAHLSEDQRNEWFYFGFNCLLVDSLLVEMRSFLSNLPIAERLKQEYELAHLLSSMWGIRESMGKTDLTELRSVVRKMFYSYDPNEPLPHTIPVVFWQSLCSTLASVNIEIAGLLGFSEDTTWIVCIDEAEFLKPNHMACINAVMRSESHHITLKVADLPYCHDMSSPMGVKIHATVGNDYKLSFLSMSDGEFEQLTNSLCQTRLNPYYEQMLQKPLTLEEFVGVEGRDDYLDYYRLEFPKISDDETIRQGILMSISDSRKRTAISTEDKGVLRQSIYKKLAPIYYLREMYKRSQKGNTKPGWYAGAKMIRKIANGNPRMFLLIMDALFVKAQNTLLTPKAQSEELLRFAKKVCDETQNLESRGPEIAKKMQRISEELKRRTHSAELKESGTTFRFADTEFDDQRKWIEVAIANSRLSVDQTSMINGLTHESEFDIANTYAAYYWVPMRRNSDCPLVSIVDSVETEDNLYTIKKPKRIKSTKSVNDQLTLFSELEE